MLYLSYKRLDPSLNYWRTHSKMEVDFLRGESIAIEVKATARASRKDLEGLIALAEELSLKRRIVVCQEHYPRVTDDNIEVLPVQSFLDDLWAGRIA
jgi:predicted AAA+ superfamily ATPase